MATQPIYCLHFCVLPNCDQFRVSMILKKIKKIKKTYCISFIKFGQQLIKLILCLYQDLEMWGYALALSIEVLQEFLIHSCTCISRSNLNTSTDNTLLTVMTPTKVPNHWGSTMFQGWDRTFEFECGELEIGFALIRVVFN